jgi:hypothetical protein
MNMTTRVHDAVWRGSTTDPIYEEFNRSSYLKVRTVREVRRVILQTLIR